MAPQTGSVTQHAAIAESLLASACMRLIDRISQASGPLAECASEARSCTARYVLDDDSARLCAAVAYSTGARQFSVSDLIRVPAQRTWVEWPEMPWCEELRRYGFPMSSSSPCRAIRRGACVSASPGGRRGRIRTFWCVGESEFGLNASAMEAHFDLDGAENSGHSNMPAAGRCVFRVVDNEMADVYALSRCFRFEFERTWAAYYASLPLSDAARRKISRRALENIAPDVPLLLALFLLLGAGRDNCRLTASPGHHLRGHLSRRRERVFWRMPAGITVNTLTLE
jgi:hypothetical protein